MQFPSLVPFTMMVTRALAGRLAPSGDEYLDMFHDEAVFEFPYLPGGPVHVKGKREMARYLDSIEGGTDFHEFVLDTCHLQPNGVVVMEYHCHARQVQSGKPYSQRYIGVLKLDGERLSLIREFLNPLLNMELANRPAA